MDYSGTGRGTYCQTADARQDPGGIFMTIILGIAGAVGGGFISSAIGFGRVTGFDIRSLIIAVGGAVLLLIIYRKFKK